jgi:hypothetical protein
MATAYSDRRRWIAWPAFKSAAVAARFAAQIAG